VPRAGLPLLWSIDLRAWLRRIRVPTLVIAGLADRITPVPRVRALHDAIAGSRWVAVDGGGHVPMTARPAPVADAVRALVGT
jgi:pimeloyl-ACP methyl ester carboxylesterase